MFGISRYMLATSFVSHQFMVNAARLQQQEKFINNFLKSAAGAVNSLLGPSKSSTTQQHNTAAYNQQVAAQNKYLEQAAANAQLAAQQAKEAAAAEQAQLQEHYRRIASLPKGPRIHQESVDTISQEASVLATRLRNEQMKADRLAAMVQQIKNNGALHPPKGVVVDAGQSGVSEKLAALAGDTATASGAAPREMEAPILWFQPPPADASDDAAAKKSVACILNQIGDEHSPALRAEREYALKNMATVKGRTLDEVQSEIADTQAEVTRLRSEREALDTELRNAARISTTRGMNKDRAIEKLAAAQLKAKDEEFAAVKSRLTNLQHIRSELANKEGRNIDSKSPTEEKEETEGADDEY